MKDIILIKIRQMIDDENGAYRAVGEMDYVIYSDDLNKYLKAFGKEGKREIIRTLNLLINKIKEA